MTDIVTKEMIERAKPILFSTGMVQAILAGNKTQTRRLYNGKPLAVGDVLYVRECWNFLPCITCTYPCEKAPVEYEDAESFSVGCFIYRADGTHKGVWKPSIHMPKRAARIFLEIVDVRVELLQLITPADCLAEGVPQEVLDIGGPKALRKQFANLWDSLIQKEFLNDMGWKGNPLVTAYTFRVLEKEPTK